MAGLFGFLIFSQDFIRTEWQMKMEQAMGRLSLACAFILALLTVSEAVQWTKTGGKGCREYAKQLCHDWSQKGHQCRIMARQRCKQGNP
jgi:hypothetical protein